MDDKFKFTPEIAKKSAESVIGKMVQANWISGFVQDAKGRFIIEWTKEGSEASKQLVQLFDRLSGGKELYANELAALLSLLDEYSPGGGQDADRHRI